MPSSTSTSERGWPYFLLGLLGLFAALELTLRVLPASSATLSGYYLDPLIATYPPHHQWVGSSGWALRNPQHLHANNVGFLAHRDFVRNPNAIALIGDSFVEASALDEMQRPDIQLEQALGSRPVYGMGVPGTSLLDYAERMRYAHEHFGTRDFVVELALDDFRQSLCDSGNFIGPCLNHDTLTPQIQTQPPPGLLKRVMRHSALAKYLVGHLQVSSDRLWQQALHQARAAAPVPENREAGAGSPIDAFPPAERAVAAAFFERVKPLMAQGRLVLVLACRSDRIYAGHPESAAAMQDFAAMARAAGAFIVDPRPVFAEHYSQHGLRFDLGPNDGHLNALGVSLIAQATAKVLLTP